MYQSRDGVVRDQVREHIDSGDVSGAVKILVKETIAKAKHRLPSQEADPLILQRERAANEFFARHPEIELQVTANEQAAFEFGNLMASPSVRSD